MILWARIGHAVKRVPKKRAAMLAAAEFSGREVDPTEFRRQCAVMEWEISHEEAVRWLYWLAAKGILRRIERGSHRYLG